MRRALTPSEGAQEGPCVRTSMPKAGEVAQHLVTASFDVVFEESVQPYHESDVNQSLKHGGTRKKKRKLMKDGSRVWHRPAEKRKAGNTHGW